MPPTIGAAMRRMTSDPVPLPNMIGSRPAMIAATVMMIGRTRSSAPSMTACCRPVSARPSLAADMSSNGLVQVHEHDDADLDGDTGQRDEAHADRDRQFVAEQVQQPETADQGQRQRPHDDRDFGKTAEVDEQQQHDDGQRHRADDGQAFLRPHHVLVLPGPGQRIACGQFDLLGNDALRFSDVGAKVAIRDVDVGPAVQSRVLTLDHRRPVDDLDVGYVGERDRAPCGVTIGSSLSCCTESRTRCG